MSIALAYPGDCPGQVNAAITGDRAFLENAAIRCEWMLDAGRIVSLTIQNRHSGQTLSIASGHLPSVVLGDERVIDLGSLGLADPIVIDGNTITATFADDDSDLYLRWSARLADDDNAVIQSLQVNAARDMPISDAIFVNACVPDAQQVGEVSGSVVVCGNIFMGVEHPLANNAADDESNVRCALSLGNVLKAGRSWTHTCVIGVVPPGQLRRGFLYYLERRRAHPYRQFLHYNNWYDVWLGRQTERVTEPECLETIEYFGRELVEKRGVKMDAFVWDDGWDDFNTLWDFHKGFPDGFRNLMSAGGKYGVSQGVWMSPNGGYATAKEKRIAYGKPLGYETNDNGYAMGGDNYAGAFRDVCLKMMRENGVVFFKFDGMGEGGDGSGRTNGTTGALSDDIHAILELSRDLHKEDSEVYVSATAGTWASPFWLLYADSIWRQGGDSGHHGQGDTRQQWITYRDMFCYERVVKAGPLYPLNSLMLHGILIGDRPNRAPGGIVLDEKSVADEIWSFFGSGTCLQELYVSPDVPTESMLDQLAAAAKWARANADTLIDTHWVGGNPGTGEVYGRASWRSGKGILVLRNPSENTQQFTITSQAALEFPEDCQMPVTLSAVYPQDRQLPEGEFAASKPIELRLQPFETVVIELMS
jgi:hypothetical protein